MTTSILAIDGPAGAGKSTIAAAVARRLGLQLIDTGAMYRTVALRAIENRIALDDGDALSELACSLDFHFDFEDGENVAYCNGIRLDRAIRTQEVSEVTSQISTVPRVRAALVELQREIAREEPSVLEGRDIGTVVFPDARLKVFLTASVEERARRRAEQLREKDAVDDVDVERIRAEIERRDERDSKRDAAPLKKADDAVEVDTTRATIEEIVDRIVELARERGLGD